MDILKHHIEYVVVVDRHFNYYLPPETTCFDLFYTAYPDLLSLVVEKGRLKIYKVLSESTVLASNKAN